jgi:photosystem II stability/assembly factor-like uncharacterized protein
MLLQSVANATKRKVRSRKVALRLESLEDRTVPSITLSTSSWTPIGPAPILGNVELGHPVGRTEVLAPDPANANVMYLAADNGGIWKTTNWLDPNGPSWAPLTDNQPSPSFGYGYEGLAVAPSNDQIIYGAVSGTGGGILRSQDGGQTWTTLANATFDRAALGSLAVDPTNSSTLYLSVWGASNGGGVYKSTDGGATWNNTTSFHFGGASDLVIDPAHPQTLYAGLVSGASAGIYKTTDGGNSWELLKNGVLSGKAIGATIRLALAPSAPNTVYATVFDPALGGGNNGGGLPHRYRTTDGGNSWRPLAATPGNPEDRSWHVLLAVDPANSQDVFANDAYAAYRSQDGGKIWVLASAHLGGDDFVGLAFDRAGGWDLFGDRSVYRSTDQGASWTPQQGNLQITEFYDLTLDPSDPNNIYGIAQDQTAAAQFTGDPNGVWNYIGGGGETGKILIDPNNPQRVYEFDPLAKDWLVMVSDDGGSTFNGSLANSVDAGGDYSLAYSCQRSFAMDPSDPSHLIVGLDSGHFFETTDGGDFWFLADSLPLNPSPMKAPYITALSIAPNGAIYAGASDGSFWMGQHVGGVLEWTEADAGLLGVARGNVVDIRINPADSSNLFVVTNGRYGNSVWMTASGGIANPFTAWINVTGDLPPQYGVATVAVDWQPGTTPAQPPVVYVGTSRGVYVSTDIPQGEPPPGSPPPSTHWTTFDAGLPITSVSDLEYAPKLGILAAGTFGRGALEILLHSSSSLQFPHFNAVACADIPCLLNEATIIAINPNPEGHVVATFTDLAGAAPLAEYRAVLQWNDITGTAVLTVPGIVTSDAGTGQFSVHVNRTAPEGRYRLTITLFKNGVPAVAVTAAGRPTGALNADVLVNDATLTASGLTLDAASNKALIGLLCKVHDTGGAEDPSHYTASLNWGDGTPLDTSARLVAADDGSLQVIGSHTYSRVGHYAVAITVMDQGGSSVEASSTVIVTKTGPTPPPTPLGFVAGAGGTGVNAGLAVATDNRGDVYVAGQYTGPLTFAAGKTMVALPALGDGSAFVAAYDAFGRLRWARPMGGPLTARATGVAVDAAGNVYVTGDFQGTALIGRKTFTALGASDSFVAKLDSKGNFLWSHQFQEIREGYPGPWLIGGVSGDVVDGSPPYELPTASGPMGSSFGDTASGIAVDRRGNVYVTGTFNQKVDFGGQILIGPNGNDNTVYVTKLDSNGRCLWADIHGWWQGPFSPPSIAVDTAGNVYSLANSQPMTMAGNTMSDSAPMDAPLLVSLEKLSTTGNLLWTRPVVETATAYGTGVAVDRSGNVLVTGFFVGTGRPVDFDPNATHTGNTDLLTPAHGTSNIFVEQFSTKGDFAWVQQIGGDSNFRTSTGIAVDKSGHVFVTGFFRTPTLFGAITLSGTGPATTFVAQLSSGGTFLSAAAEGGADVTQANAIALDPSGFAVLTGEFQGTTQMGSFPPLTSGGGTAGATDADAPAGVDVFVVRLQDSVLHHADS